MNILLSYFSAKNFRWEKASYQATMNAFLLDHRLRTAFLPWKTQKGYRDKNYLDKHIIGELAEPPLRKDSLTGIEIKQDSQITYKRK